MAVEQPGEDESRGGTGSLQDEVAYLIQPNGVKPVRTEFAEPVRIIHHIQWLYHEQRRAFPGMIFYKLNNCKAACLLVM